MTPCEPTTAYPHVVSVTGGSGFIGRAVAAAAVRTGQVVFPFDNAHGQDVLGDLGGLLGSSAVIHLAGVLGTHELFDTAELAVDVNVKGTLRVLQFCAAHNTLYVGITMPPVFHSVYTATKVCADRLATAWHEFRGVPVSHVRAFNAYGPGQKHGPGHPQKILPTFAIEAWAGRPLPIFGDGHQTMDLIHVDDLGRMLLDATRFGDDQVFDGGTGVAVSVNDLADFVLTVTGSNGGVQRLPMRDGEVPQRVVAMGQGWDLLGWRPQHDWDRIAQAVNWYHPDNYRDLAGLTVAEAAALVNP